jgi:hypothetical protein
MSGASASAAPPKPDGPIRVPVPSQKWRRLRWIPLAAGAGSLLAGLWVGLARLGLMLPGGMPTLAEFHGTLMISGFLGTVISLERAVAIGRWWSYAAPTLSAIGAVALVVGAPVFASGAFLLAGIALTVNSGTVAVRQPALFTVVLTVAAACWVGGTVVWINGAPAVDVAGWGLAFLVLTIAAERLELSRLLSPPRSSQLTFMLAAALIIIGAMRGELAGEAAPFSGLGLLALTVWLVRHDIALRTIRLTGTSTLLGGLLACRVFLARACRSCAPGRSARRNRILLRCRRPCHRDRLRLVDDFRSRTHHPARGDGIACTVQRRCLWAACRSAPFGVAAHRGRSLRTR